MRRRSFLGLTALAGLGLAGCDSPPGDAGPLKFSHRLRIPPVLAAEPGPDGTRRFTLTLRSGRSEFLPGKSTPTWGVNGAYLGPTLRASQGEVVELRVVNRLDEATSLHWHGMRLPAEMAGAPEQLIDPKDSWSPQWTIKQPAASTWYHPYSHDGTGMHLYRGLAGLLLLDDERSTRLGLPERYGVDDIPLILQDKSIGPDGAMIEDPELADPARGPEFGLLGDKILVNGTYDPYLKVTTSLVRFRLLNAGNARVYRLGFTDSRRFYVIATDAGLLPEPVPLDRVAIAPGERVEIVAEFIAGESVVLRTFSGSQGVDEGAFEILQIKVAPKLKASRGLPKELSKSPLIQPGEGDRVRKITLSEDLKINDQSFDPERIDLVVPSGAREIWELENLGPAHSFHLQEASFRVLDVDGTPPHDYLQGPKDTVFVPAEAKVRLAVRFGQHTDPNTPYVYHCNLAQHEHSGMMGQFVVVKRGTQDRVARELGIEEEAKEPAEGEVPTSGTEPQGGGG